MTDSRPPDGGGWFTYTRRAPGADAPPRPEGYPLCSFCGLDGRQGVAGPTPDIFICFDCIDLVAEIKAETLHDPGAG